MYAVSPIGWTTVGYTGNVDDYSCIKGDNWMYMGYFDTTITRVFTSENIQNGTYIIFPNGSAYISLYIYYFYNYTSNGVRPTFYLDQTVSYVSGDGSQENPYRID